MDGIYLTMAELEVLSRCSGVAVKAYLRLRARMDIRTGLVGQKSGMSYQALREWTEEAVEKGSGETLLQPSMRNVRTAVEQLVRRGLLVRMRTEKLVFRCALADFGQARSNRTRHEPDRAKTPEPDTEPDTNPAGLDDSNGAAFSAIDAPEPGTEPDTNPAGQKRPNPADIGVGVNPSLPQAASTAVNGVDAGEAIAAFGLAWKDKASPTAVPESRRAELELVKALRLRGVNVTSASPHLQQWVAAGVTLRQLQQAVDLAESRREDEGSKQPINAGFLNVMVGEVLNPPRRKVADAWWKDEAAMDAKAREVGCYPAPVGHTREQYIARIRAAISKQEGRQA